MTDSKAYNERLMDHYHNPRNFGRLDNPALSHQESNRMCGDRIQIDADVKDGRITDIRFEGRGCAISIAAASILTDMLKGQSLEDLKSLDKEQMLDAIGVPLKRTRINCALLGLKVFRKAAYGE